METRRAIQLAAIGIAVLVVGGAAWRVWRRWSQRRLAEQDAWFPWPPGDGPLALIHAATLATSPHGMQPWRFEVDENTIVVYADQRRHLEREDPFRREMHLALGCALENLSLAARAQGLEALIETPPGRLTSDPHDDGEPAAIVRLVPAPREQSELFRAIPDRHTHDGSYRRRAVPSGVIEEVRACVPESPAMRLFVFTGRACKALGERILAAADDLDGADKRLSVHVRMAPMLGLIAVRTPFDRPTTLAAGQSWERIQLLLTARGLVGQSLEQIPELADSEHAHGLAPRTVNALAALTGDATWHPAVVFRAGYPRRPPHASSRRPLISVIDAPSGHHH
jgi:hypothetical protein